MRPAAGHGDNCVSHWELKNKNNISGEEKSARYLVLLEMTWLSQVVLMWETAHSHAARCRKLVLCWWCHVTNIAGGCSTFPESHIVKVHLVDLDFEVLLGNVHSLGSAKYSARLFHTKMINHLWIQMPPPTPPYPTPLHLIPLHPTAVLSHAEDTWPKVEAKPAAELIFAFPRVLDCSLQG